MAKLEASFAEVNLDNLIYNYRQIKSKHSDKKICGVVKANAYGHGYQAIGKCLADEGIDYFAVSSLQEAILLRKSDIKKPILLLSAPERGAVDQAIKYNIETTVFNLCQAQALSQEAKKQGRNHKIHIKIDTGMNRIGFKANKKSLEDIEKISGLDNLHIGGIFTHFACADTDSEFTKIQDDEFEDFILLLKGKGIGTGLVHKDNSAAALGYDHGADMIRFGIGLYGLYPSQYIRDLSPIDLRPLMSLKSTVSNVKYVKKGESISYGSTYVAEKDIKIATIGCGYADGIPRILSNRANVFIKSKSCPIVGNICMDQMMVEVSGLDVCLGDEAEIFGENISISEQAEKADTISYEILCNIGMRVPRIYMKDGEIIGEKWYMIDGVN